MAYRALGAATAASLLLIITASAANAQRQTCGPEGDRFVCGQIIVGLTDSTDATIEDVVTRNEGNADTDILNRIEGIRAYTIGVPTGEEQAAIERYSGDPAVEYADVNGVEGGVALPDTAMVTASHRQAPLIVAAALGIGVASVLLLRLFRREQS